MKLSGDILYNHLSKYVAVEYAGKHCDNLSLMGPMFYQETTGYRDGVVYIGSSGELPPPPAKTRCLIVCVGGRFPSGWAAGMSCTFSVLSETDIFSVFNILSETFSCYDQWESDMRRILDGSADLTQMVEETAAFFGCVITVNDNQLQPVCRANERIPSCGAERKGIFLWRKQRLLPWATMRIFPEESPFFIRLGKAFAIVPDLYPRTLLGTCDD